MHTKFINIYHIKVFLKCLRLTRFLKGILFIAFLISAHDSKGKYIFHHSFKYYTTIYLSIYPYTPKKC